MLVEKIGESPGISNSQKEEEKKPKCLIHRILSH